MWCFNFKKSYDYFICSKVHLQTWEIKPLLIYNFISSIRTPLFFKHGNYLHQGPPVYPSVLEMLDVEPRGISGTPYTWSVLPSSSGKACWMSSKRLENCYSLRLYRKYFHQVTNHIDGSTHNNTSHRLSLL